MSNYNIKTIKVDNSSRIHVGDIYNDYSSFIKHNTDLNEVQKLLSKHAFILKSDLEENFEEVLKIISNEKSDVEQDRGKLSRVLINFWKSLKSKGFDKVSEKLIEFAILKYPHIKGSIDIMS